MPSPVDSSSSRLERASRVASAASRRRARTSRTAITYTSTTSPNATATAPRNVATVLPRLPLEASSRMASNRFSSPCMSLIVLRTASIRSRTADTWVTDLAFTRPDAPRPSVWAARTVNRSVASCLSRSLLAV
jgi:hypothetical protein